jgi:hypothetical protein
MIDLGYDPFDDLPATMVMTDTVYAALVAAQAANGYQPLSPAQVTAAIGPAPPAVTELPYIPGYSFDDVGTALGTRYRDVGS